MPLRGLSARLGGVTDDWQDRLIEAMALRQITGAELARRSGFTSQYINSLRSKGRGGRLPLETAQRLAQALQVTLEWLTQGDEPRDAPRLSDVYPIGGPQVDPAPADRYPSRAEAIALLASSVEPEVIAALRTVVPRDDRDPGREFWIDYARDLARSLRKIKADPVFSRDSETSIPASESLRAAADHTTREPYRESARDSSPRQRARPSR